MTDVYACGIEAVRPEGDLFKILGLQDNDLLRSDLKRINAEDLTPEEHYAWRVLIDPVWGHFYKNKCQDTKQLYDAGFFDDGLNRLPRNFKTANPKFACTSTQKLQDNLDENKTPTILFTTGGMAPIHNGHLAMMETARAEFEKNGHHVIGGYFCPGHDSYVGKKYNGTAAIPAEHRCAMVELAVQDSNWLELDPWAARFMPTEVNFTDVYERLRLVIYETLRIQVFNLIYVYGDDNKGFQQAPVPGLCVARTPISSKAVREGDTSLVDPRVAHYLAHWQDKDTNTLPYLIRNEEDLAVGQWYDAFVRSNMALDHRKNQLQSAIRLGIAQLFQNSGAQHKCHLLPISSQYENAKKIIGNRKTISLDAFYQGTCNFSSTRVFALGDAQFKPLYRAERPGCGTLLEQAQDIKPGDYVLVEDDTVTGQTIMSCRALLPKGVNITDQVILSDFADYPEETYYDVVDMRDFIVGSKHSGLSVEYKTFVGRAPYTLPFVSLRARAKIPASMEIELSRVIWQSNVRFFKNTKVMLAEADHGFQKLAMLLGWRLTDHMEDICQWYADALMEIV